MTWYRVTIIHLIPISDLHLPFFIFHSFQTGSKVISRKLSLDCLAEVESVLQRSPLIWDNLHANDYDSRRLFLGPFKGRDPQIRSHLRGLLLNPNCEFEANYIPLHTLGTWYRTGKEVMKGERMEGGACTGYVPVLVNKVISTWSDPIKARLRHSYLLCFLEKRLRSQCCLATGTILTTRQK